MCVFNIDNVCVACRKKKCVCNLNMICVLEKESREKEREIIFGFHENLYLTGIGKGIDAFEAKLSLLPRES